jgi:hypothetical protein
MRPLQLAGSASSGHKPSDATIRPSMAAGGTVLPRKATSAGAETDDFPPPEN